MLDRYPHIATITIETEEESASGIPTISESSFTVKGRYEPNSQMTSLNYSAKYYCKRLDVLDENPNALDGQKLFLNRTIGISQAWNYQTHCEIWLD